MLEYRNSQQPGSLHNPPPTHGTGTLNLDAIPPGVIELLPASVAREHFVIPVASHGETVVFATDRPNNIGLADKLTFIVNCKAVLTFAPRHEIAAALNRYYRAWSLDSELEEMADAELAEAALSATATFSDPRKQFPAKKHSDFVARGKSFLRSYSGQDTTHPLGASGMFFHVVEEGQRVLVRYLDGTMEIVAGPRRLMRWFRMFTPMSHFIAHPGEFLVIRYRDGRQEHLVGPSEIWLDPRIHEEITKEQALQLSAKEAVVVYSKKPDDPSITRRIVYGPAQFVPQPGEWLHTFTWHASQGGHSGAVKIPKGLVFQKLWLMPDQMYHDVADVRTADDAVLTIRLMIFFELIDIERMLETTHDPIGDFVNAATSDVVAFVGKYDFESFKRNVAQLNEIDTYKQIISRAQQCGYRITKVVYRGYGAPDALQKMHDEAIQARTKLQLQRATEQQAQDLENYKLDCQIDRAVKRREEQSAEVAHDLEMIQQRQKAELEQTEARQISAREQERLEADQQLAIRQRQDAQARDHLAALREFGVDLTAYLTQARADRVIEFRGATGGTHVHLDSSTNGVES